MAKILVNYPTRNRFSKFLNIFKTYVQKSSKKHDIWYLIKIDQDDVTMNNDRVKKLCPLITPNVYLHVLENCKGKIDAINRHVNDYADFDVVLSIADDMHVLEDNWDDIVIADFAGNYDQCLNYNIDPRLDDFKKLVVLPIIGVNLYKRFNYVYHPDYISEWCDNEQTEVFESMNKLKHIDKKIFYHDWSNNQDFLMQRNISIGHTVDVKTYQSRKQLNFGL